MTDTAKPATPKVPKGAPGKPQKPREEVLSKDDFVNRFNQVLLENLDVKVSKQKAWDIFKTAMNVSFELAAKKPLSLSGIGRFGILSSKRSEKANKPALRMRFKASSRVNEVLNGGTPFVEAPAPATAKDNGAKATVPAAAPAGATAEL